MAAMSFLIASSSSTTSTRCGSDILDRAQYRRESANIDAPDAVHYTRRPAAVWRRSQVVRQRSAKPLFAGSIPAVASIPTPPGFNLASAVVSHGWYRLPPTRWSDREQLLRRAEVLGGRAVDLEIPYENGALQVRGAGDSRELRAKIGRMFQLDLDLSEFHDRARQSPAHDWVVDAGFGRLLCGSTLFEDVVKIITTTNTMWRQTVRMTELLVEKCGRRTRANCAAFPAPQDIVRFRPDELQQDCRLGYRAKSIHGLAKGIIDGSIDVAR